MIVEDVPLKYTACLSSAQALPPVLESLEPRVLLSGSQWVSEIGPEPAGGPLGDSDLVWKGYDAATDGAATESRKIISGVPAYDWRYGCGPTAAGMVVGYWDSHGFGDLVAGDAASQTPDVNAMMAGEQHYADYSVPIDDASSGIKADKSTSGDAHSDNSLADWMHTSWSYYMLYYGWSYFGSVDNAIDAYCTWKGYEGFTSRNARWGAFTWGAFTTEIDANRPMVFLVDTDGNGSTDHFVTAIGYDTSLQRYACYDTWDSNVHWYDFAEISNGQRWGVYGATFITPPENQPPPPPSEVVGRHVFYNNSALDGRDVLAGWTDDAAIDAGKHALLPNETPSSVNYTAYSGGLNGVMIDIAELADPEGLSVSDFQFSVGRHGDPASWAAAPAPVEIAVRQGAGTDGSDRVTIIWADGAIVRQWLAVTTQATVATGLEEDDVFSFANLPGDADGDGRVDLEDFHILKMNFGAGAATLEDADFDASGLVDLADFRILKLNFGASLSAASPAPSAAADSLNNEADRASSSHDVAQAAGRTVNPPPPTTSSWTHARSVRRRRLPTLRDGRFGGDARRRAEIRPGCDLDLLEQAYPAPTNGM